MHLGQLVHLKGPVGSKSSPNDLTQVLIHEETSDGADKDSKSVGLSWFSRVAANEHAGCDKAIELADQGNNNKTHGWASRSCCFVPSSLLLWGHFKFNWITVSISDVTILNCWGSSWGYSQSSKNSNKSEGTKNELNPSKNLEPAVAIQGNAALHVLCVFVIAFARASFLRHFIF